MAKKALELGADFMGPLRVPKPAELLPENLPDYALVIAVDRAPRNQVVSMSGIERDTNGAGHVISILHSPEGDRVFSHYPAGKKTVSSWWRAVKGEICDDSHRFYDAYIVRPLTPTQHAKMSAGVDKLQESPPLYRILGLGRRAKNCVSFLTHLMKDAGLKVPFLWKIPAPIMVDITIAAMAIMVQRTPQDDPAQLDSTARSGKTVTMPVTAEQTRSIFVRKAGAPAGLYGGPKA